MNPEIAALVDVQTDDLAIHQLEQGIEQLMPKVNALNTQHEKARASLDQARQLAETEAAHRREIQRRIDEHRQLHEKHQAVLSAATNQKEATAATAQLEQVARFIADEERELGISTQRHEEIQALIAERETQVAELEQERDAARASIAEEETKLRGELDALRGTRDAKAKKVSRGLMSMYDRIRSRKRVQALFALRGSSCGNCDTAIPMQRRAQLVGAGRPEVCEGCGVLLYAAE